VNPGKTFRSSNTGTFLPDRCPPALPPTAEGSGHGSFELACRILRQALICGVRWGVLVLVVDPRHGRLLPAGSVRLHSDYCRRLPILRSAIEKSHERSHSDHVSAFGTGDTSHPLAAGSLRSALALY
jgi:hypothetical protein